MEPIPKDIIASAEKLLHYNNLLIEQCDRWLPAEEGNRNMLNAIMERRRKEEAQEKARKKLQRKKRLLKILNFLNPLKKSNNNAKKSY